MIRTDQLTYDKDRKVLVGKSYLFGRTFPKEIMVLSVVTGRTVRFIYDLNAAYDNEFWDGEQMEYKPEIPLKNVTKLVIYHE